MNNETTQVKSNILDSLTGLSQAFGTGNVVADVVLVLLILSLLALVMGIVALYRRPKISEPQSGRYDNIGGRLERTEMALNEFKTEMARTLEKFKGEIGYVKQELLEVKALIGATEENGDAEDQDKQQTQQSASKLEVVKETFTNPQAIIQPLPPSPHGSPKLLQETQESPQDSDFSDDLQHTATEALSKRLVKSRTGFFEKLKNFFGVKQKLDAATLGELEAILVSSDIGVKTTSGLLAAVKSEVEAGAEVTEPRLIELLKTKVLEILDQASDASQAAIVPVKQGKEPLVVLMVGVNGVGKTTTTAKLASLWKNSGAKVMMVAADTFRAAAVEQLKEWGARICVPVVSGAADAKPQTVVFDAMQRAKAEDVDVVIIDTAGRLHTKSNLMQELEGIKTAVAKHIANGPHETILVLDGSTGQNALSQAKEFNQAVKLSGIIVTKLDGTPKGGIVVAIKEELGVKVRYIGVGESAKDLREFDSQEFVEALFNNSGDSETQTESAFADADQISAHAETRRRKRRDTQSYIV